MHNNKLLFKISKNSTDYKNYVIFITKMATVKIKDLAEAMSDHSDATVDILEVMSNKIEGMSKNISNIEQKVNKHSTFLNGQNGGKTVTTTDKNQEIDQILDDLGDAIKKNNTPAAKAAPKAADAARRYQRYNLFEGCV